MSVSIELDKHKVSTLMQTINLINNISVLVYHFSKCSTLMQNVNNTEIFDHEEMIYMGFLRIPG